MKIASDFTTSHFLSTEEHSVRTRISKAFSNIDQSPFVQYGLLILLVLIGTGLRLYQLGTWSLWVDEVYTIQRANDVIQNGWEGFMRHTNSTRLVAGVLMLFPESEWSVRLVPALVGIISMVLFFFPVRRIFGGRVALMSMAFLAISPWHLYWSQNSRFYTTLLFFYTLSLLYFYIGVEERRPSYLLGAGVLLVLGFLERLTALFAVPIMVLYISFILFTVFRNQKGLRFNPYYGLPILIVPAAFLVYDLLGVPALGLNSSIRSFFDIFFGHTNSNPVRLGMAIIYRIGLPVVILASIGALYLIFRKPERQNIFLLLAVYVPFVGILVVSLFAFAVDRYIFASLPFWYILCAVAINQLFSLTRSSGTLLVVGVLALVLADGITNNMLYFQYQNGSRPDMRGALEFVAEHKSEEAIIAVSPNQVLLGDYYLGDNSVIMFSDIDQTELERTGQPMWFIVDNDIGWIPASLQTWLDENARLVLVRDIYLPGNPMTLRVYAYREG